MNYLNNFDLHSVKSYISNLAETTVHFTGIRKTLANCLEFTRYEKFVCSLLFRTKIKFNLIKARLS